MFATSCACGYTETKQLTEFWLVARRRHSSSSGLDARLFVNKVVNKVVSDRPSSVFVEALLVPDARLFVNKVVRETDLRTL